MGMEKIKVYTYTRVSTTMQIDVYSLDAQMSRMERTIRITFITVVSIAC